MFLEKLKKSYKLKVIDYNLKIINCFLLYLNINVCNILFYYLVKYCLFLFYKEIDLSIIF